VGEGGVHGVVALVVALVVGRRAGPHELVRVLRPGAVRHRSALPHHAATYAADWGEGNRIWCAFFHRGVVRQRSDEERADEWLEMASA
jgi:hypothetical protein